MRELIKSIDSRFELLAAGSISLLERVDDRLLFRRPREIARTFSPFSCGEYLLRSAGAVEQMAGGISRRLWDDPFEWTLPEELNTPTAIADYVREVEGERADAFAFLESDTDLSKMLPAPREFRSIHTVLIDSLARASHFQGRAFAIFQMLSDEKLPPV